MQTTRSFELRRQRDFGQALSAPFEFLRENFRTLVKSLLYIAGPVMLLAALISGIAIADLSTATMDPYNTADYDLPTGPLAGLGFSWLLTLLTSALISGIIAEYVVLYLDNGPDGFDVSDVWVAVREDLGLIIGTSIGATILTMLGFMLLVIPGIYLVVTLSILLPVRVVEREGFFDGVSRSRELIRGNWWLTLGLLIVMSIIVSILNIAFSAPYFIVETMQGAGLEMADSRLLLIASSVFSSFGGFMLQGLTMLMFVLHYFSLVEQHEGVGVLERIDSIGGADSDESGQAVGDDYPRSF